MDQTTAIEISKKYLRILLQRNYPISRAILFGSYANDQSTTESDLDLLVEVSDSQNIWDTYKMLNLLFWDRDFPIDFLVRNVSSLSESMSREDSIIADVVLRTGRLLYEKQS